MHALVVDDHPILRMGVRQLIEGAWPKAQVAEAENIADALAHLASRTPDIIVLDLALPDAQGTESAMRVLRAARGAPVLVLSQNSEPVYAPRLLQQGVRGFLPKDRATTELVGALRRILDGGRYVTASMADHLLGLLDGQAPAAPVHERLSTQEFRVLQLVAAGRTPAQIAELMHLSVKTVGSYRARLMEKGGWASNAEMVKYCLQNGLVEPD